MKRDIKLSKRAAKKLGSLLIYLDEEWSPNVKYDFIQNFDNRQAAETFFKGRD